MLERSDKASPAGRWGTSEETLALLRAQANAITKHMQMIAMYLGIDNVELLEKLEGLMKHQVSDLNSLSPSKFAEHAKDAFNQFRDSGGAIRELL